MLRRINPQSAGIFSPNGVFIYLVNTKISIFYLISDSSFFKWIKPFLHKPETSLRLIRFAGQLWPALRSGITLTLLPLRFWFSSLISPAPRSFCRNARLPPHPGQSLSPLQYQAQALQISVNTNILCHAHLPMWKIDLKCAHRKINSPFLFEQTLASYSCFVSPHQTEADGTVDWAEHQLLQVHWWAAGYHQK